MLINYVANCKKRCLGPSRLFSIAILRKSSSCVTSYQDALVSYALLLRFDKKSLPVYVLRTYFYVNRYACVFLRDRLSILSA